MARIIHKAQPFFCTSPNRSFHGIQPSKNTRERRAKKAAEEVAKKRAASELGATSEKSSLQQMKEVGAALCCPGTFQSPFQPAGRLPEKSSLQQMKEVVAAQHTVLNSLCWYGLLECWGQGLVELAAQRQPGYALLLSSSQHTTPASIHNAALFCHLYLQVQKQAAAPYVVLSGTIKPGQSRDAKSGGWWVLLAGCLWAQSCVAVASTACLRAVASVARFYSCCKCCVPSSASRQQLRRIALRHQTVLVNRRPAVPLHSESCAACAFSLTRPSPTAPALPAGYATVDKAEALTAPTPVLGKLGGGQTPLVGIAKVGAGSGWIGGCWCDGW